MTSGHPGNYTTLTDVTACLAHEKGWNTGCGLPDGPGGQGDQCVWSWFTAVVEDAGIPDKGLEKDDITGSSFDLDFRFLDRQVYIAI